MLQPKGKLTKTLARKSTARPMTEEEKEKYGKQLGDTTERHPSDRNKPRLQMKVTQTYRRLQEPSEKLKTKKATAVTTSPLNNERVMKNSPASKPKMKTLKGKIQMALYKAKNMKKG